jgi:predicted nuclease of predicted toxin-antitoxin system
MGLPRRAVADLHARFPDTVHVAERGLGSASDREVLEVATREGRVVITLDGDFSQILALEGLVAPSVIHSRIQGLDRARLVDVLQRVIPPQLAELRAGCVAVVSSGSLRIRSLPILHP